MIGHDVHQVDIIQCGAGAEENTSTYERSQGEGGGAQNRLLRTGLERIFSEESEYPGI